MSKKRKVYLEQFYTKNELAGRCVDFLKSKVDITNYRVVEPSAGRGVFSKMFPDSLAIDIDPKDESIIKHDFFTYNFPMKSLFIGNPPYGSRGSLAMKFIQRSCEFADIIAFILPRSFKKYTFIDRIPINFHLIDQFDCEDFEDIHGNYKKVKSVFQIWKRENFERIKDHLSKSHPDFTSKHVHMSRISEADYNELKNNFQFGIPQVGAKFKPVRIEDIPKKGSWWLISQNENSVFEKFNKLDYSFLDEMNTSFKSLSIKDIVKAYGNY
jgi:hypothetical protein